jgi:hypothetical protein
MATQTRRTTRRSARFFRATVKAAMVTAWCGLVLLSAVSAYAETPRNGLALNGVPLNGMPRNGLPFQGLLLNGTPLNGMPVNGIDLNGTPINGTPLNGIPWNGIGPNGIPFNGLPIQGMPMQGMPHNDLPTQEGALPTGRREHLPWSTLSHRALGEAAAPSMRDGRDILPVALPTVR